MKKLVLGTLVGSMVLASSLYAEAPTGKLELISNLKITGDARVRGLSTSGITTANTLTRDTYDSRIRVNLDTTTEDGIQIHTRIVFDNQSWGNTTNQDNFSWDEASILVPLDEFFFYGGRINDTYGTEWYGSHGDKLDLAFFGYTGIKDVLLYAFDYKIGESLAADNDGGPFSTSSGDTDAYALGGQITIDKMLIGGRYVKIKTPTASSGFTNIFTAGEFAGLEIEAQAQYDDGDSDGEGYYLNIGKQFSGIRVGLVAGYTESGFAAGDDVSISYLTDADTGINSLGKVGAQGDTKIFAAQVKVDVTDKLAVEGIVAMHDINDSTLGSIGVDEDIIEYNVGAMYKLGKSTSFNLRYAGADLDNSGLEDIQNYMAEFKINF